LTSCWCKDYYIYIIIEMNVIEMDVYIEKGLFVEKYCFEEKGHDEINIMECQWSEGLYKQGIFRLFQKADADIFCIQESKVQPGQIELELDGYHQYWNYAERKGYSGTAVFTRIKPLCVQNGIGIDEHDREGRVITLEFDNYYLVNVYTPNAKKELERLDYRMKWEDDFRNYLVGLKAKKPVIVCGDMNVAHKEIDLKNPESNRRSAGLPMKSAQNLRSFLMLVLLILSDFSILIKRVRIHGGHTCLMPVPGMQGGELIIFVCRRN